MKIRTSFVSNSSSSSFIALFLKDLKTEYEVLQNIGLPEGEYNWDTYESCEQLENWGYDAYRIKGTDLEVYIDYDCKPIIGLEIGERLKANKTLSECKEEFRQLLKDTFNADTDTEKMSLEFGEWGQG